MPRRTLDGPKLMADVARLEADDKASPPTARPSLMDAVRSLSVYIERRAKLGWTGPAIAKALTGMGYPIDAATLHSYRKRLRDEDRAEPTASNQAVLGTESGRTAGRDQAGTPAAATRDPGSPGANPSPAGQSTTRPGARHSKPGQRLGSSRHFAIDPSKLPPDQA